MPDDQRSTIDERCSCGAALRIPQGEGAEYAENWRQAWLKEHAECSNQGD